MQEYLGLKSQNFSRQSQSQSKISLKTINLRFVVFYINASSQLKTVGEEGNSWSLELDFLCRKRKFIELIYNSAP